MDMRRFEQDLGEGEVALLEVLPILVPETLSGRPRVNT